MMKRNVFSIVIGHFITIEATTLMLKYSAGFSNIFQTYLKLTNLQIKRTRDIHAQKSSVIIIYNIII